MDGRVNDSTRERSFASSCFALRGPVLLLRLFFSCCLCSRRLVEPVVSCVTERLSKRSTDAWWVPLKEPFRLHQDVDVFNATAVGKVEPFGQVSLQVRLDLLVGLFALKPTQT